MLPFRKIGLSFTKPEVLAAEAERNKPKESNQFAPGLYDVKIVKVEPSQFEAKDPTWVAYSLSVESGKKSQFVTLSVPTEREEYITTGNDGEERIDLSRFLDFKTFCVALGFSDPDECVYAFMTDQVAGRAARAEFGYPGHSYHLDRDEKGDLRLFDNFGKVHPLSPVFANKDESTLWASKNSAKISRIIVKKWLPLVNGKNPPIKMETESENLIDVPEAIQLSDEDMMTDSASEAGDELF